MPLLSFERANQWVPLDFMLKTDKMKLPLHEFSFVKATAPFLAFGTVIFRTMIQCSRLLFIVEKIKGKELLF